MAVGEESLEKVVRKTELMSSVFCFLRKVIHSGASSKIPGRFYQPILATARWRTVSKLLITIVMAENNNNNRDGKQKRGFAAMDEEKQRAIASKGGKAAHESGNAHEFTSEEAREAGRKGGESRGRDRGRE
jgi:uncharacterized protein